MTADPEKHTFEVAKITERDLFDRRDGHKLTITQPTHGENGWTQSNVFALTEIELADLLDEVENYLADLVKMRTALARGGPGV